MIEAELDGQKVPIPYIIRAANRKSFQEIHNEIRSARSRPEQTSESKFMGSFLALPAFARHLFVAVMRFPALSRRISSSVLVTAVGMFGRSAGWAITMPNFSLTVALGSIAEKPGVVEAASRCGSTFT